MFLCYLTGKSRFIGALRATSDVFTDTTPIWRTQVFPTRFKCELLVQVPEDRGVHLREVQERSPQPDVYNWIFRASPQEMPADDSRWIMERLREIARDAPSGESPVQLEVGEEPSGERTDGQADVAGGAAEPRAHTRIQWRLAKLGRDMGLRVWIARNDKTPSTTANASATWQSTNFR